MLGFGQALKAGHSPSRETTLDPNVTNLLVLGQWRVYQIEMLLGAGEVLVWTNALSHMSCISKSLSLQANEMVCSFQLNNSHMNLPSGHGGTRGGFFSNISSMREAQEEWMAVMTWHNQTILLPSAGKWTSVEESIQPLDLSFAENALTLGLSWSGWIMTIIIDSKHMRQSWKIIAAWSCQKVVVISLVWKRGEWIK